MATVGVQIVELFDKASVDRLDHGFTLDKKVCYFFANCTKRDARTKAPKSIVRPKGSGQDAYQKAHPDEHNVAFKDVIATESPNLVGQKLNVGQKRHFSSVIYHQLPLDQQDHWRQVSIPASDKPAKS
ncbi:hypothetical protein FRC12_003363 [Ceratobasidium sp. 428]|nr:hypothetical protein FRC12_003363 [Ceratobasidium sp. 428]